MLFYRKVVPLQQKNQMNKEGEQTQWQFAHNKKYGSKNKRLEH